MARGIDDRFGGFLEGFRWILIFGDAQIGLG